MSSRIVRVLAVVVGASAVALAAPQSVDELVARNIEAKGGLARLREVRTIKQVSRMRTADGMEATQTTFLKRPNLMRQEVSFGGQLVINAFDGVTPWIINPFAGPPRPIAISGPQADAIREQADFDGRLVDYHAKGYAIALAGAETMDGRRVHHLRITAPSKQLSHLYLDAATGLEVKETTAVDQAKLEQQFSDYRTVDGLTVPFLIRLLTNGVVQSEIRVQSVEFNVQVDDAIFRMPKG
jgi:outer membrane lipoprotein-sorting protein